MRRNPASLVARMWQGLGVDNSDHRYVLFLGRTRMLLRAEAYDPLRTRLWFRDGAIDDTDPSYAKSVVVPNELPLPWVKSRPRNANTRKPYAKRNPSLNAPPQPPPSPLPNPGVSQAALSAYERFHGIAPNRVEGVRGWVPGGMVVIGTGVDVGYKVRDGRSAKGAQQPYVHDFGSGVTIYRRARANETPDKTWRNFPADLMVLGSNIGFSYRDENGRMKEVKGAAGKRLAVTPDRHTLVIVGRGGVEYVMHGGAMHVSDWIHD